MKKKSTQRSKSKPKRDEYPKGWSRKRVEAVASYYDSQSDDGAIAEIDAAFNDNATALIQVPIKLVPAVQKLLAKRAG